MHTSIALDAVADAIRREANIIGLLGLSMSRYQRPIKLLRRAIISEELIYRIP